MQLAFNNWDSVGLEPICVGCNRPYLERCEQCTNQVTSIPGPRQMTGSERYRAVMELYRLAGHGVDEPLCCQKVAELAGISQEEARAGAASDLAELAKNNREKR